MVVIVNCFTSTGFPCLRNNHYATRFRTCLDSWHFVSSTFVACLVLIWIILLMVLNLFPGYQYVLLFALHMTMPKCCIMIISETRKSCTGETQCLLLPVFKTSKLHNILGNYHVKWYVCRLILILITPLVSSNSSYKKICDH
jgi:hypothetical protein